MKKERLVVYPFDVQFSPVLRHKSLLEEYEIVALVSPRGWGFTDKDACEADEGESTEMIVSSDFDKCMELCDTVFFGETIIPLDFDKYIMPKVNKAVEAGKNILFSIHISVENYEAILKKCNDHNVSLRYFNYWENKEILLNNEAVQDTLYDINTPVIFVMGMGERTNKFEIQLSLREQMLKKGYSVGQIGTRSYCELMGFHSFPSFMFSNLSEANKIILFNNFVKKIEQIEKPDVIIIGIPDGVMPVNRKILTGFGIFAYEVSQAVIPDTAILSTYYEDFNSEYYAKMVETIKIRLGCNIDCFNVSNNMIDWIYSNALRKMTLTSLDSEFIDQKIKKFKASKIPVFNVLNSKDSVDMADYLIDILAEYGERECI